MQLLLHTLFYFGINPAELNKQSDNKFGAKQDAARYKGVCAVVRGKTERVRADAPDGTYIGWCNNAPTAAAHY